jgi:hypothetical protein
MVTVFVCLEEVRVTYCGMSAESGIVKPAETAVYFKMAL